MSRLTQKYQVTLPKEVRKALKVSAGDSVDFMVLPKGNVQVIHKQSKNPFDQYIGFLKNRGMKNSDKIVAKLRGHRS